MTIIQEYDIKSYMFWGKRVCHIKLTRLFHLNYNQNYAPVTVISHS